MATIETRPFATSSKHSVQLETRLLEPDVPMEKLSEEWEFGRDVVVRVDATIADSFWQETGVSHSEGARLTATAACFPARASWTGGSDFRQQGDGWRASVILRIDGAIAAEEVTLEAFVSGPGRTRSDDARFSIHQHAKLWESGKTVLALEQPVGFPTSALSFEDAGRYEVPWMVEVADGVDAEHSYSSAIRLYVNTDLEMGVKVLETTASPEIFLMLETEIQFAVLHALWRDSRYRTETELLEIAEGSPLSFAALGQQYARNLGMSLREAMRLSHEEPLKLLAISRERQKFMNGKARKR